MDLYAYTRIGELEKIVKENNIKAPRLRGYRLGFWVKQTIILIALIVIYMQR